MGSGTVDEMEHAARPTLLVFTLGAAAECRRRRLLPAAAAAEELALHRALLDAALSAGAGAGCRCVVAAPAALSLPAEVERVPQPVTGSFGDRLRASVAAAWRLDAPLVVVGTDVPGLGAEPLRRALAALDDDPATVVVGPSPDGGCYLLAARQPLDAALAATRWRSRRTLASLRAALAREGRRVVLLPPLADLDHRSDLEGWLARPRAATATAALARLRGRLRRDLGARPAAPAAGPRRAAAPLLAPLAARPPPPPLG